MLTTTAIPPSLFPQLDLEEFVALYNHVVGGEASATPTATADGVKQKAAADGAKQKAAAAATPATVNTTPAAAATPAAVKTAPAKEHVELRFSAQGLAKMDAFSASDPMLVVWEASEVYNGKHGNWEEGQGGRSEVVMDSNSPNFQFVYKTTHQLGSKRVGALR